MNLDYVLPMGVGMVPLAIILDRFALLSWSSDFVIVRMLFTLPGLVCTLLGLICWQYLLTYAAAYIGAFIRAWCGARRG